MTIEVEDGTGKSNAESYVSVADADTYHTKRGHAGWAAATTGEKEAALVKATFALDAMWGNRFKGQRTNVGQALEWPRAYVVIEERYGLRSSYELGDTDIPQAVKHSTLELASIALTDDLIPSSDRGGRVASESVGPIAVTYFSDAPSGKSYPQLEGWLRRYLRSSPLVGESTRG